MVVSCEIEFDNNLQGTYFAGQLVSGTVVLRTDKPKDVKGVLLKVHGKAFTRWSERRFNTKKFYSSKEDYMSSLTYLVGSDLNTKCTIDPGIHSYTFTCQLPYNCPTSFEGRHGYIRYMVKVVLVRPWKFDQTYTRAFTVLKTMDLNFDTPQIRLAANSEAYRTFCCGPCKTEPVKIQLHLPQAGYVPGQIIPVNAVIANNTNIPVSEVKFFLAMMVRYISQTPSRTIIERVEIAEAQGEKVLKFCTRSLKADLLVPPTPPTCTHLCNIIHIAYQVEVLVKMKGCHADQVVTLPVNIGNVPLQTSYVIDQQPTSSRSLSELDNNHFAGSEMPEKAISDSQEKNVPEIQTEGIATISVDPLRASLPTELPPPSYEESMHTYRNDINEDEQHTIGTNDYTPLYPVFSIPSSTKEEGDQKNGGYDNQSFEK